MMPDREEVKYAMDCLLFGVDSKSSCKKCAYFNGIAKSCSILTIMHDAFELLKEDEKQIEYRDQCYNSLLEDWNRMIEKESPVEPVVAGGITRWYACGACSEPIDPKDQFCRHCGKPVMWSAVHAG